MYLAFTGLYNCLPGESYCRRRDPVWPSGKQAGNRRTSVRFPFGSLFSYGCGLWTLSCGHCLAINETLKWLSSLPIFNAVILVVTV